jgi:hypothetical protein
MRLPDFMIIGAAKSGTTTLYEYLCRHPQIYMSTPKEPEFFARDKVYSKGLEWYSSLFVDASSSQLTGEASTIYTRYSQFPKTAERIYQVSPHIKFIYIMRHPVDRAYSHYVQRIKTSQNTKSQLKVNKTFEESLSENSLFIDSSNYMMQIEHYLQYFPQQNFLFLLMEDLLKNSQNTLTQICQFLGIDDKFDLLQNTPVAANIAEDHFTRFIRSRMTEPLRAVPGVSLFASTIPQSTKDTAYQLLRKLPYRKSIEKEYSPRPMLLETRQMLIEKFAEPNRKLADFLDRDLSHWSN